MSNTSIIIQIKNALKKVPEKKLDNVLTYIQSLAQAEKPSEEFDSLLDKIFSEDKELLNKLAQ
jgi:hypothetical protein